MILLLGGTSDSLQIASALNEIQEEYLLSVTSNYGAELAKKVTANIHSGRLDLRQLTQLIHQQKIELVVDATHPYAVEVSQNAMAACEQTGVDYFRFERPSYIPAEAITVFSISQACEEALNYSGNIYLTTGSKQLPQFLHYLPIEGCVIRVLPTSEVLQAVEDLGFQPHQIEAMKGPFTQEMNQVLMAHHQIGVMITKESGKAGGFQEKVLACQEMSVPCIVIQREGIAYPKVFDTIEDLIAAVKERSYER